MKHYKGKKTLGRKRNQRQALMKTLAYSLVQNGKITTTETKAKELRPFIEKLVTKAKIDSVATRRLIASRTGNQEMAKRLVDTIAPQYKDRNGGYTRIIKLPLRQKDAAKMAHIEFV